MAKKISQLTQATEVKSDDVTVIVQDGETKKLPLNMMVTKQDVENKKIAGLAKLDEIEATYENDTYTPTITVKNKSSVKTGEGDEVDYSANVMDGHAKSAILKGQTLVNLFPNLLTGEFEENTTTKDEDSLIFSKGNVLRLGVDKIKTSTTYTFILDIKENTLAGDGDLFQVVHNETSISSTSAKLTNEVGLVKLKITTLNNLNGKKISLYVRSNVTSGEIKIKSIMLLEGDYTNVDIPYFDGMQSVKMPVLKSVSSTNLYVMDELLDEKVIIGNFENSSTDFIRVYPNEKIFFSTQKDYNYARFYDENKQPIGDYIMIAGWNPTDGFFEKSMSIVPENGRYLKVFIRTNRDWEKSTMVNRGEDYLPYEKGKPYKSNILTVNEPIELRGIGNVQDELNLKTGELTQRIGKMVIDGREEFKWGYGWNDYGTAYPLDNPTILDNYNFKKDKNFICEQVPTLDHHIYNDRLGIAPDVNRRGLVLVVPNELTGGPNNVDGLRTWLNENPLTVFYEFNTDSVKTVDLMPSGTHPSTTPYCWKNGHIQLSSSGLLPNLEYSVVTSRAGQINQNATMIVKNDKRIFDLEILLAGGLVNTTYQALTLQNQVETGLSKVSLSSETEPDYLLYHMIMKLIEEKAYKLDDLTEKVSVFYLYEKLSDEQFETIYSALYPFVEDEIVEEPVVEELPEVVEDEVIM